ncbi:MAG: hypothetical protein DYG89_01340 [Caldilinea sp. CFX5]|nr:hypothetical protein [Caldilinea sp. CFX5]
MAVAILIDENLLPEKGVFELNLKRMCQINITAEEARRQVHRWLIDEVSSNIGAERPTLVLSERPVWRVPAVLSFPRYGRVGSVGSVDVDVETGKMPNLAQAQAEVEHHAEALAQRLPPYQPSNTMPPERMSFWRLRWLLGTKSFGTPFSHLRHLELLLQQGVRCKRVCPVASHGDSPSASQFHAHTV